MPRMEHEMEQIEKEMDAALILGFRVSGNSGHSKGDYKLENLCVEGSGFPNGFFST